MKGFVDLLHPFGLAWIGASVLLWQVWSLRHERRNLWRTVVALWLMLSVTGWTPFAERLLASLERPWKIHNWDELPQADALLFLGGGASASRAELIGLDMNNGSDRVTTAIQLVRLGKAPVLVAGGGVEPSTPLHPSEGVQVEWLIHEWKLSEVPIYQLGQCANTHEESLSMKRLVDQHGWKSVLFVTSASHMQRAAAAFRKQGVPIVPVACGFRSRANLNDAAKGWISTPDGQKVDQITIWLQETIGYAYYWLRGWL